MATVAIDKKWHAVYVNSRSEKKVGDLLSLRAIDNYVPVVKTMRQWSDRKKMVELPLLNGYVFVHTVASENDKVLTVKGVVSFVKSEGKIAVIREAEIDRLKQLVALGYALEVQAISRKYQPGEKIRIREGVLKGLEGFVVEDGENRHIDVLLESIGQCIRVKLPRELLMTI